MKKIAFWGAMIAACAAFAGTYTWNGASGGDWAVPGNWLVGGAAAATAPTSADNIEFNSAAATGRCPATGSWEARRRRRRQPPPTTSNSTAPRH